METIQHTTTQQRRHVRYVHIRFHRLREPVHTISLERKMMTVTIADSTVTVLIRRITQVNLLHNIDGIVSTATIMNM